MWSGPPKKWRERHETFRSSRSFFRALFHERCIGRANKSRGLDTRGYVKTEDNRTYGNRSAVITPGKTHGESSGRLSSEARDDEGRYRGGSNARLGARRRRSLLQSGETWLL